MTNVLCMCVHLCIHMCYHCLCHTDIYTFIYMPIAVQLDCENMQMSCIMYVDVGINLYGAVRLYVDINMLVVPGKKDGEGEGNGDEGIRMWGGERDYVFHVLFLMNYVHQHSLISSFAFWLTPKGSRGYLMSPPCLESQGCHLIPLCYLLSCSSA